MQKLLLLLLLWLFVVLCVVSKFLCREATFVFGSFLVCFCFLLVIFLPFCQLLLLVQGWILLFSKTVLDLPYIFVQFSN